MSVATAIENLSVRIQDAYSALQAKGATMPVIKNTANLSTTIDSIPEVVLEDKGVLMANLCSDYISSSAWGGQQTNGINIIPSIGYDGIMSALVQYRTYTITVAPSTQKQVKQIAEVQAGYGMVGWRQITVNPVTNTIDSNIQAGNIKNGVTILGVTGNLIPGITPSGNIQLTSTAQTDVTNYATAQVVDADLVAGNIKKDVNILGVTGTYEGSGGGGGGSDIPVSDVGYTVTLENYGSQGHATVRCHKSDSSVVNIGIADGTVSENNVVWIENWGTCRSRSYSGSGEDWTNIPIVLNSNIYLYYDSGCLLKGTLVNLCNGKTKPIEDITYDDEILCWDFDNGKYASAKPFWIKKAQKNTFYWINKFESGKEIKTTGTVAGHRFFDIDKRKFLYNTECIGDLCYTKDGPDRLLEAKYVEGECEFYNIYTNYHMNLFANGILTGFRYNNLYLIKDMKFVKDGRVQRSREEFKSIPDSWFYGMRCAEQTDSVEEIIKYALSREIIKK